MSTQRGMGRRQRHPLAIPLAIGLAGALGSPVPIAHAQNTPISNSAYNLLNQRVAANQTSFFVYLDQDAGLNHGFPTGYFPSSNAGTVHVNTGCIDALDVGDSSATNGCSTQASALDQVRGTVMQVSFDPQSAGNFAGVNIEEPQNWGAGQAGQGYDLRGATSVTFDVRSPDSASIQVGVGGCMTPFFQPPSTWTTMTVDLSTLNCTPDLSNVHILFTIVTNAANAPNGGTALFDNVQFVPVPTSRQSAMGFPLANQTFGSVPQQNAPIPPDQLLRNLTTIYESALTLEALLARGTPQDLANAQEIADTFDYALHHDNHGDPLPTGPSGVAGLHTGYEDGDIALFNTQPPPAQGQAGDVRLAGFTATQLCAPSGFCLVLDDATGGNNAFAIIALVQAYQTFGNPQYLDDAREIGNWIISTLADHGSGYGGYFSGYFGLDTGMQGVLNQGKSTENNADIFAAMTALETAETQAGNRHAAAQWRAAANRAGDFVMRMYDTTNGRFNLGTEPAHANPPVAPGPGFCPGPRKGNDILNTCDFLDADTFPTLAMAGAPRYQNQIDWRQPISYVIAHFRLSVTAGGSTFNGFDLVPSPVSGPNGIAWEFTGQVCVTLTYVDQLYGQTTFEPAARNCVAHIRHAQIAAPFGDGMGVVAATLERGKRLPPLGQCLDTPYQCIAERVGLAATTWAIFAEQDLNPF